VGAGGGWASQGDAVRVGVGCASPQPATSAGSTKQPGRSSPRAHGALNTAGRHTSQACSGLCLRSGERGTLGGRATPMGRVAHLVRFPAPVKGPGLVPPDSWSEGSSHSSMMSTAGGVAPRSRRAGVAQEVRWLPCGWWMTLHFSKMVLGKS
jgi:hypothetical protein